MAAKTFAYKIEIESSATTKELAGLELQLNEVNKAIREAKKAGDGETYEKLRREQLALQDASKELRKEIRQQQKDFKDQRFPEDSLIGLRKRYRELRREINALSEEERKSDFGQALIANAKQVNDSIKDITYSVGDFRDNVGNYRDAINGLGDLDPGSLVAGLFDGSLAAKVNDVASSMNPYAVAATAAVAGTVALAKEIVRVTEEYTRLNAEVTRLTGLEGFDLQAATIGVKALADTFDQDFNDVLLAANTLTREVTGDFTNSIDLIKTGFLAGADASGEFLDSIREYSSQVQQAGIDGETFLNILIRSTQEGIFSDKGIDAVKEFGLRIREQTTATKDALEGAFGTQFTQELFDGINDGSVTTVQALTKISRGLKDNELTAKQVGTVLADVFGGAGEDAGLRFIEILADIDGNLSNVVDTTDAYTRRQLEAYDASIQLSGQQQILANQFAGVGFSVDTVVTKMKAYGTTLLNDVVLVTRSVGKQFEGNGLLGGLSALGNIFNPGANAAAIAEILADDAKAREEIEAGELATAKQRRELAVQGKLDYAGLQAEQAKIKNEIIEAKLAGEDYGDLQNQLVAITRNLASATAAVSTAMGGLKDKAEPAEGSIRAIKDEITEIKRQLEVAPDPAKYAEYYKDLLAKEKELEEATRAREKAANDAVIAANRAAVAAAGGRVDIGVTSTLGAAQGLVVDTSNVDITRQAEELKTSILENEGQKRIALEEAEAKRREEISQQLAISAGELLGTFASGQIDSFADFSKQVALIGFKAFEAQIPTIIAAIFGKEVSSKGFLAGGATAIIATAALKGLLTVARTAILGAEFAEGGRIPDYSNIGTIPNRQNTKRRPSGDRVVAYLTPGEVVLNKRQQELAAQMYGTDIFAQLGIPGFATGGIVPNIPQLINPLPSPIGNIGLSSEDIQAQAIVIAQTTAQATRDAIFTGIYEAEQRRERREQLNRSRRF